MAALPNRAFFTVGSSGQAKTLTGVVRTLNEMPLAC